MFRKLSTAIARLQKTVVGSNSVWDLILQVQLLFCKACLICLQFACWWFGSVVFILAIAISNFAITKVHVPHFICCPAWQVVWSCISFSVYHHWRIFCISITVLFGFPFQKNVLEVGIVHQGVLPTFWASCSVSFGGSFDEYVGKLSIWASWVPSVNWKNWNHCFYVLWESLSIDSWHRSYLWEMSCWYHPIVFSINGHSLT
jgi:hypothetical protein